MGIRPHDGRPDQRPVTPETQPPSKHGFRSVMLQRFQGLFSKHDHNDQAVQNAGDLAWPDRPPPQSKRDWAPHPVSIGLPRQATLRRLNSEKKEHLTPVEPCAAERRAASTARPNTSFTLSPRGRASSTPPIYHQSGCPTPGVSFSLHQGSSELERERPISEELPPLIQQRSFENARTDEFELRPPRPPSITSSSISHHQDLDDELDEKAIIKAELDSKWILNLSMHFRDKSDREKFFVTYAETPTKWRRVTVSCDYREAEPGSLEMDLKELQFQRDKSLQIYESIRDSLPEIQFYDTVTNLKLETSEGRLHVHVTEDVNETIPYPPRGTVTHILGSDGYQPKEVPESELKFESHLSGFVYKVSHDGRVYIKKEIPGPDTVDEFLYEINALHALHGSEYVIQLEAIVVDDTRQLVKGLLISYAERGAIVDLLYDLKGQIALEDRLRWGRDAVAGLSEIHDEGYVQGDFTLSNIVVDAEGRAKIIDINRRGCPVGWEPPEIAVKIASHQRISMYIGEKSDLYQLGMTLWGLAADDDEPERHDPPVSVDELSLEVPEWFKDVIKICLDSKPKNRKPARELLKLFPVTEVHTPRLMTPFSEHFDFREQKRYIDPHAAVEREDLEIFGKSSSDCDVRYSPASSRDRHSFTYPRSSNYHRGSETSDYERPRGRTPPRNIEHLRNHERRGWSTEEVSISSDDGHDPQILSVSPRVGPQYDEIELDGKPFLIARNTFEEADFGSLSSVKDLFHFPSTLDPSHSSQQFDRDYQPFTESSSTLKEHTTTLPHTSHVQFDPVTAVGESAGSGSTIPVSDAYESASLAPDTRRLAGSVSPQPPPSLSYADSGFHEPADDDDLLPQPYQSLPASCTTETDSCANEVNPLIGPILDGAATQQHVSPAFAPSLQRSDTSFRIPMTSSDNGGHSADTCVTKASTILAPASNPPLSSTNNQEGSVAPQLDNEPQLPIEERLEPLPVDTLIVSIGDNKASAAIASAHPEPSNGAMFQSEEIEGSATPTTVVAGASGEQATVARSASLPRSLTEVDTPL